MWVISIDLDFIDAKIFRLELKILASIKSRSLKITHMTTIG